MTEPEATESQYSRPPSYGLSKRQREYVASGDTGSYRESELEAAVEEKAEQLGHRLDHLLSDVEHLAKNGYLDEDQWKEAWLALAGFDEWENTPASTFRTVDGFAGTDHEPTPDDIVEAFTVGENPSYGGRPTSAPAELARDVGQMLQRLTIVPDEGPGEKTVLQEMAWGLVRGFYYDLRAPASFFDEPEEDPMAELLEYFDHRHDMKLGYDKDDRERFQSMREAGETWKAVRGDIHRRIRDILKAEDLPVHVSDALGGRESDGISVFDVYHLLIHDLVADVEVEGNLLPQGDKPFTKGQESLFRSIYGPVEEFDTAEVVTREAVLSVVSKYNMLTKAKLDAVVAEEADRIAGMTWKTIDAAEVLDVLVGADGALSSAQIAKEIEAASHKGSVTKLCRDLAGRAADVAVLKGDPGGWRFTEAGELIKGSGGGSGLRSSVWGDDPDVGAEQIEQMAGELGISTWEWEG
ncbi:hypothetical protein [Halorubrum tropicale]|uniref:Uncharacterized protein n=1 Tax=Halorubrum tropicale TaxID=1765655 RepID=A0A0M9AIE2_9EURY|nr:hypothetical protein [Halorubrum tropicale]KOX92697.1 hypothetical protein AMR74_16850 [Halorubrum tropicale]